VTVHVLVEGPSERELLGRWAPRFAKACPLRVHAHQGKGSLPRDLAAPPAGPRRGLLDQLPAKLRAFGKSETAAEDAVLVLVDADDDDPDELRTRLLSAAKTVAPTLRVAVAIAVEETEAFCLGDLAGLERAYPHADMKRARGYVPDSICGTWELFGQVIGDHGENKVRWAEAMGPKLTTSSSKSRSPSFKALCAAMELLCAPVPKKAVKKRYFRHRAQPDSGLRKGRPKKSAR